ncbi:MAG: hypothetical protein D6795_20760 [Deltaproteobacteria bacterium]|nr:MAG: hypothetical protein D6795_20760 [Deltaproteobacteria bacterium]
MVVKPLLRRCCLVGVFSLFLTGFGEYLWLPDPPLPFDEDLAFTPVIPDPNAPGVIFLEGGEDLQFRAQEAIITARPGTTIVFPEGTFYFKDEIVVDASHVTLAGQGIDRTILDFSEQESGAQGILARSDAFGVQDLTVQNTQGDAIKIEGANGVTIRRTRITWSGGPKTTNGAYGLYPVLCRNVLIEDSIVSGASDAGIYVGQSSRILVRRNRVEYNVAGIEIENSTFADVSQNWASFNTAGILVFDLPNLEVQGGRNTRVFGNVVDKNTTPNFAPEGNIVGMVPSGIGIMIMANDEIEVFDNQIRNNGTAGIAVVSYLVTEIPISDPNYDPFAETIHLHDNRLEMPYRPYFDGSDMNILVNYLFRLEPPDIIIDGIMEVVKEGGVSEEERLCMGENITHRRLPRSGPQPAAFGNMNLASGNTNVLGLPSGPVSRDPIPFLCAHPPLEPIELEPPLPIPEPQEEYTPEEIEALCGARPGGVNWGAFVVACPDLADYDLFADPTDPLSEPNGGGIPYILTTPLFSDYTQKRRVVFVPPGGHVVYDPVAPFHFPVGTIIAKTFLAPDGSRPIETRLLVHREEGWVGIPYIWEGDHARLAVGGGSVPIEWTHEGEVLRWNYLVPNMNQCASCHTATGEMGPIGPKAKWLNRDDPESQEGQNQLSHWADLGLLVEAPADPAQAPRLPVWNDPTDGTLEARAKAYLDINCAHCHNPSGLARNTALYLHAENGDDTSYGICKPPVAAGPGSGDLHYDIVPGDPEASILYFRMNAVEPAIKMPELARNVIHEEGVALIGAWIESLEGRCTPPGEEDGGWPRR